MLIFLDLETTGLSDADRICSIAVIDTEKYMYSLVNEGKKISTEASSINHITREMLKDKGRFVQSELFAYLQKHNTTQTTLVVHNATFVLKMLSLSGLEWRGGVVDTLKVSKHLIPECEHYSLQFLRYELRLYREETKRIQEYGIKDALYAHHALSDAITIMLLFEYLLEDSSLEMLQELSFKQILLEKFSFGKHKGKYIEEVVLNDISYVQWLLTNGAQLDEDMRYSLEYHLQG